MAKHAVIKNLVHRALVRTGILSTMESTGLSRSDGKRPDDLIVVPWFAGRSIIWDAKVVNTLSTSYIQATSKTACGAAEIAVTRKEGKYIALSTNYNFIVIALETLGPFSAKTSKVRPELGRHLTIATEDLRETAFLFQRISVAMQRFKGTRSRDSFPVTDNIE